MAPAAVIAHDPDRELRELREYLGDEYDEAKLRRYEQTVVDEFRQVGDEQSFYRTSQGYLYDLTAFAASGTKLPYLEALVKAVPPPARLLDYGCGIGADGLLLLEAGYGSSSPTSTTRASPTCAGDSSAAASRRRSTTSTPARCPAASTAPTRST